MQFDEVIRKRRMVRAFTGQPIDEDVAQRLLKASNRAPSAGFSQGNALLVLERPAERERFWGLFDQLDPDGERADDPVRNGPLIAVPLASMDAYLDRYARPDKGWTDRDPGRWPVPFWYIDTGFVAMLLLLATVDEGLGALYFGFPPEIVDAFRAEFGVPAEYTPIGAIVVGHPDLEADKDKPSSAKTIKRTALDEFVHRGGW